MTTSFATDIRPLFRNKDVKAMVLNGGFDLSLYDDVVAHADNIHQRLSAKTMPCDGGWPDANIALFGRWIQDGKQP